MSLTYKAANARLMKLAKFLRTVPAENFNFGHVLIGPNEKLTTKGDCGSSGCAIGWCPAVFPKLVAWYPKGSFSYKVGPVGAGPYRTDGDYYSLVGEKLFKLTREESNTLFTPFYNNDLSSQSSASKVADHIEAFVANRQA